jgi:hypothetical protein
LELEVDTMAKDNTQATPPAPEESPGASLERWMTAHRQVLSWGELAASALFGGLFLLQLFFSFRDKSANLPVTVWAGALTLLNLGGGLYLMLAGGGPPLPNQEGQYRLFSLVQGGLAGLVTFIMGVWLPLGPWAPFIVPAQTAGPETTPLLDVWKENWWRIGVVGLSCIGGLALMFISLLPARGVERTSSGMRRLLYGYNAALTGLLLLAILGLFNILSYVHLWPFTLMNKKLDWTPSQLYTLSPASINILEKEVTGSVEIIAMMPFGDRLSDEVTRLINNLKEYNKNIKSAYYSPDVTPTEFQRAQQQYAKYVDPTKLNFAHLREGQLGLIVVYRSENKEDGVLIPYDKLYKEESGTGYRMIFRGENEVMRALVKLTGKVPTKVYFTTGHGELSINAVGEGRLGQVQSAALLKQMLDARGNYEFKEVDLDPEGGKELGPADVVVIARPTTPFSPRAIASLRNYLKPTGTGKKGKLVVLLGTQAKEGKMMKTGLEDLLREFGVEVGDKRLLAWNDDDPEQLFTYAAPGPNPIALAFSGSNRTTWPFSQPRFVTPTENVPPAYAVDILLRTETNAPVWEESNLVASGKDLLQSYEKADRVPRLMRGAAVAVAVSEVGPGPQLPEGHPRTRGDRVPLMVVIGDGSWISDNAMRGSTGNRNADLFHSCLSWLRGRADLGRNVAADKERSEFTLRDKLTSNEAVARVRWLPPVLIFIGIIGLGGGIWVVRRR